MKKTTTLLCLVARGGKAEWHRSKDRKFIDWKRVRVSAGKGGDGCVSFIKTRRIRFGSSDGGDGGAGGDVVVVAEPGVRSLSGLRPQYRGRNGNRGSGGFRLGATGRTEIIRVPLGTVIRDVDTGRVMKDLTTEAEVCVLAQGGEGGLGNAAFATAATRRTRDYTEGDPGKEREVEFELKTIADVGMVGFPNAGKSTLLRAISQAKPRVAAYPFTTLNPHIGMVEHSRGRQTAVADIPGLVPGAHLNKGLGISFLRHVERCKSLLYVLDVSSIENDLTTQLHILQDELDCYKPGMNQQAILIIANKMDICRGEEEDEKLKSLVKSTDLSVLPVSALHGWNVDVLIETLAKMDIQNT